MSELKKVKVISWGRNGNIRTDSNLDTIRKKSLFYRLQWYWVPMIESDLLAISYCRTLLLTKIFESLSQKSDLSGIGCWCGQKWSNLSPTSKTCHLWKCQSPTSDTDINEALTFRDCRFVRGLDRFTTGWVAFESQKVVSLSQDEVWPTRS